MSIDAKDIKVGDRYLCEFPNSNFVSDYLVVEIVLANLQDKKYVKIVNECEIGGKWVTLDTLSSSIIGKLEDKDEYDLGEVYDGISVDDEEQLQLEHEKNKEKMDYLQEFVEVQTEYLKMLIGEKKNTDNWKG